MSKETAERVARHLVSAGELVDDDPERALEHARAARALAGRVGSVREAVGISAYRAGEFGEALAELRAARRITGRDEHLPVMADCERALGRPDRALALIASPAALRLDAASRIELKIVESGVRRDLGQPEAAVLALQGPELDSTTVQPWSARLWYAHAAALLEAGRRDEALRWFHAVTTVDDGDTDAEERILALTPLEEESGGEEGLPTDDPVVEGAVVDSPVVDSPVVDSPVVEGPRVEGAVPESPDARDAVGDAGEPEPEVATVPPAAPARDDPSAEEPEPASPSTERQPPAPALLFSDPGGTASS